MFQDPSMVVNEYKIYRSTGVVSKQPKKKKIYLKIYQD